MNKDDALDDAFEASAFAARSRFLQRYAYAELVKLDAFDAFDVAFREGWNAAIEHAAELVRGEVRQ